MTKWASWLLGGASFLITAAAWSTGESSLTIDLLLAFALCALGGMIPLRLPGLQPLPLSLPLVGAVAVVSDAGAAMTAGFLAGAFTVVAPRRGAEARGAPSTRRAGAAAACLAGVLSLAAGMVASGYARFGLLPAAATTPSMPPLVELGRAVLYTALVFWLAWCAIRLIHRDLDSAAAPGPLWRALAASTAVSSISLALCMSRLALHEAITFGLLAGAGVAALPLAWRSAKQEREIVSLRGRARTGFALVESIALAIEARDQTSERHLRRMRIYSLAVGRHLGLSEEDLESLEYAALLHDIGKLVVPESILTKPASLSPEEYQVMAFHAKAGAEILESTSLSTRVAETVRHHHERYDGSGYPDGLVGMEIPLGARILAAVDTFEAMTSRRPHRQEIPAAEAATWIRSKGGVLFDPRVADILARHHAEIERQVTAEEAARPLQGAQRSRRPLQLVLDRIASSNMEVYSLHELNDAMGQTLSLDESFRLIAGKIERLLHFSACAIYLLDTDNEVLWPRFATGTGADLLRSLKIPVGQKITGWVAANRRPVASWPAASAADTVACRPCADLVDLADDPRIARLSSALVAPLIVEDTVVGVIALYDDAENAYSEQEEQLLVMAARQVAKATRAGLLLERTQENALTDSLTGLPNSRYMFMAFGQEAARARQEKNPLTVMIMDIDGFREVNDDYGHHAGDRFLIGMARAIRSQMRICDTCVRYSGDEFVAILPRLGPDEIETVVERLMDAAKDYCMEARPGKPVRLNLSIGYATMPADGEDFEGLLAVAGTRMKQHKARTRNRDEHAGARQAGLTSGGRRVS
ncbi:MAG: diguanylate cyclase [Candidatus Polarisedimenticolia bacterium]